MQHYRYIEISLVSKIALPSPKSQFQWRQLNTATITVYFHKEKGSKQFRGLDVAADGVSRSVKQEVVR